jgi:hypothetical protein
VTRGAFSTEPRRQSDCGRPDHWAAAAERKSRFLQAMIYRGDVATEVTKLEQQDGGNLLLLGHGRLGAHRIDDKPAPTR